jgi:hypothetical protein
MKPVSPFRCLCGFLWLGCASSPARRLRSLGFRLIRSRANSRGFRKFRSGGYRRRCRPGFEIVRLTEAARRQSRGHPASDCGHDRRMAHLRLDAKRRTRPVDAHGQVGGQDRTAGSVPARRGAGDSRSGRVRCAACRALRQCHLDSADSSGRRRRSANRRVGSPVRWNLVPRYQGLRSRDGYAGGREFRRYVGRRGSRSRDTGRGRVPGGPFARDDPRICRAGRGTAGRFGALGADGHQRRELACLRLCGERSERGRQAHVDRGDGACRLDDGRGPGFERTDGQARGRRSAGGLPRGNRLVDGGSAGSPGRGGGRRPAGRDDRLPDLYGHQLRPAAGGRVPGGRAGRLRTPRRTVAVGVFRGRLRHGRPRGGRSATASQRSGGRSRSGRPVGTREPSDRLLGGDFRKAGVSGNRRAMDAFADAVRGVERLCPDCTGRGAGVGGQLPGRLDLEHHAVRAAGDRLEIDGLRPAVGREPLADFHVERVVFAGHVVGISGLRHRGGRASFVGQYVCVGRASGRPGLFDPLVAAGVYAGAEHVRRLGDPDPRFCRQRQGERVGDEGGAGGRVFQGRADDDSGDPVQRPLSSAWPSESP